jgi:hypothetical protein
MYGYSRDFKRLGLKPVSLYILHKKSLAAAVLNLYPPAAHHYHTLPTTPAFLLEGHTPWKSLFHLDQENLDT